MTETQESRPSADQRPRPTSPDSIMLDPVKPGQGKGKQARQGFFNPPRVIRWMDNLTFPFAVFFILHDRAIHPAYNMTWRRKFAMSWRIFRATRRIKKCGTSWRAHLAMASKLLTFPPEQEGVVVECGCWQGASSACLSIICEYADRQLIVYDSFEGLPPAHPRDERAREDARGFFRGPLEVVRGHVRQYGYIDRCTFRKGWFEDTLPHHEDKIVLAYIDVDYQKSLHDCVTNLWPWLVDKGYMFIDEYLILRYCALFWSERWWRTYFNTEPPGMIGAGVGVGVGQFWIGPKDGRMGRAGSRPYQAPHSAGYTRKDFSGYWSFYPDETPADEAGATDDQGA